MSWKDFPCEQCGAESGDDCAPECPNLTMSFEELERLNDAWDVASGAMLPPEVRPMDESLAIIAEHTHLLPFGSLIGIRGEGAPVRDEYSAEEYLHRLADWLADYQPMLRAQVDDLHAQSRQRISMQIERDVLDGMIRRALEGERV